MDWGNRKSDSTSVINVNQRRFGSLMHSLTHSLICITHSHSLTRLLIHSLTHPLTKMLSKNTLTHTPSLTHLLTPSPLQSHTAKVGVTLIHSLTLTHTPSDTHLTHPLPPTLLTLTSSHPYTPLTHPLLPTLLTPSPLQSDTAKDEHNDDSEEEHDVPFNPNA